jgi:hypothetical protein
LNEERKIQLPDNLPPSPVLENKTLEDVKMLDADEENHDSVEDGDMTTDEDPPPRSLRRGQDRANERKRKRDLEQEKKEKAEAEAKIPKQTKAFTKLLKEIQKKEEQIKECEDEINTLDNDLREADCPRTRVLGKDRFWNRYYWFERNGMPYGGLPKASTSFAGYANGCIWVQGPDKIEREGYIDMKPEWENEYRMKYNITPPERKRIEEGPTSVFTATQWGYYDTPEAVDKLITWLDVRGINEIKLSKELKLYRNRIVERMENRTAYLSPQEPTEEEEKPKAEVPKTKTTTLSNKRMSTRKKEAPPPTPEPQTTKTYRCLAWKNLIAIKELGHLHSEQPRSRKPSKKSQMQSEREKTIVEEEKVEKVATRGKKKDTTEKSEKGEKLGRQGGRYNF